MANPYQDLPAQAFWRSGVVAASPFDMRDIYRRRWDIAPECRIATAGSCFAQHIARALRKHGGHVIDMEPAPAELPNVHHTHYGYSMYSARYGNIYTAQQLLQLAMEATGGLTLEDICWPTRDGRFVDALRPSVEPDGLSSPEEVLLHRRFHLKKVSEVFHQMDILVFTLGLTEGWRSRTTGTIFPLAPGVSGGVFDDSEFEFVNFDHESALSALMQFCEVIKQHRKGRNFRMILTVSPVPLTATASDQHVLLATTYSKSVLRAVAGSAVARCPDIDYFPSYEIITNPLARGVFFESNLRSVRPEGVAAVMRAFFAEHAFAGREAESARQAELTPSAAQDTALAALQCEEELLDGFRA